jgi:high-affinity iron transporter
MISIILVALREGLEAALIVGIMFSIIQKFDQKEFRKPLWFGVIAAVVVSAGIALLLRIVGAELEGNAEKIFEAFSLLVAAGMLMWMILWVNRQSATFQANLETRMKLNGTNQTAMIFSITFFSVVREGLELALLLLATGFGVSTVNQIVGTLIGILSAVLLGWLWYRSSNRLSLRRFFQITNLLLILFSAGMVAQAITEFNELGWIPGIINPLYDISHIFNDQSPMGGLLSTLLGYSSSPTLTRTVTYLLFILPMLFFFAGKPTVVKTKK